MGWLLRVRVVYVRPFVQSARPPPRFPFSWSSKWLLSLYSVLGSLFTFKNTFTSSLSFSPCNVKSERERSLAVFLLSKPPPFQRFEETRPRILHGRGTRYGPIRSSTPSKILLSFFSFWLWVSSFYPFSHLHFVFSLLYFPTCLDPRFNRKLLSFGSLDGNLLYGSYRTPLFVCPACFWSFFFLSIRRIANL